MKKLILSIAALGAALLPGAALPAAAIDSGYQWGDVNCSGAVTSADISVVVAIAAGGSAWYCGMPFDLNCSGTVSSSDISIVSFIAAGGTYTVPAACG